MNEIKIGVDGKAYRLTDRNNGEKYTRAVADAGEEASPKQILAHYDKLAGNIQDKDHQNVPNGPFWAAEKARIGNEEKDLINKSDEELEAIIRRAENTHISGSLFQRAKIELELRDRRRRNDGHPHKSGIFFEVGGDMRNDGVIQTDKDAVVGVKVRGNYTSKKGKILQRAEARSRSPEIVIGGAALLIAFVSIPWWPTWYAYFTQHISAESEIQTTATSTLMLSDILARYNSFDTNLEQRNFLEKYRDAEIYGRGTYENIDKPSNQYIITIRTSEGFVSCYAEADLQNEQRFSLLKKGQSMTFSGIFGTGTTWGGGWTIQSCKLFW